MLCILALALGFLQLALLFQFFRLLFQYLYLSQSAFTHQIIVCLLRRHLYLHLLDGQLVDHTFRCLSCTDERVRTAYPTLLNSQRRDGLVESLLHGGLAVWHEDIVPHDFGFLLQLRGFLLDSILNGVKSRA